MEQRHAEDANYWQTTVPPAKSQAEIIELLDGFGAGSFQISQGKAGDRIAWLIRFEWMGHSYRFLFAPLDWRVFRVTAGMLHENPSSVVEMIQEAL